MHFIQNYSYNYTIDLKIVEIIKWIQFVNYLLIMRTRISNNCIIQIAVKNFCLDYNLL